jgi:hypothetical protein
MASTVPQCGTVGLFGQIIQQQFNIPPAGTLAGADRRRDDENAR